MLDSSFTYAEAIDDLKAIAIAESIVSDISKGISPQAASARAKKGWLKRKRGQGGLRLSSVKAKKAKAAIKEEGKLTSLNAKKAATWAEKKDNLMEAMKDPDGVMHVVEAAEELLEAAQHMGLV